MERADFLEQAGVEIRALQQRGNVVVDISVVDLWMLASLVQLANRHLGGSNGACRDAGARFLETIKERICEPGSVLEKLFEMGNDPDEDVDRGAQWGEY